MRKIFSAADLHRLSIRQRLLLVACLWLGGLVLVAGLLIPKLVADHLTGNVTRQLEQHAVQIHQHLQLDEQGRLTLGDSQMDATIRQADSELYWMVVLGEQRLYSASLNGESIRNSKKKKQTDFLAWRQGDELEGPDEEALISVISQTLVSGTTEPVMVIAGVDEDPTEYVLESVIGIVWTILLLLFVGFLVFTLVQVQWSLRPLTRLQQELNALKQAEQKEIESEYPAEVAPLVKDLNALLFHYQELLHRARNQAGNLSHSIKTPLSVLKNQVSELPDAQQAELHHSIQQVQDQIDYHLGRARMAGAMNILSVKSNPSERVDAMSMAFDKVYAHREVVLVNELEQETEVAVEKTDLDEMLGNLIENAYKWAKSLIRVHGEITEGELIIVVEDNGPGIAPEQLEHIVRRGVRLDETTPGSGLGLNIVSEVVHSYRGKLTFSANRFGGLNAILILPLASPEAHR